MEVEMSYEGNDRRRHPRVNKTFIVSYRVYEDVNNYDLTQTKNISIGGMLLTTNRQFNKGMLLAIDIRLPFLVDPLSLKGRVVESRQVVKNLIYDTHLELVEIDRDTKQAINKTVVYNLKKKSEQESGEEK
jgi:hypothetical protein